MPEAAAPAAARQCSEAAEDREDPLWATASIVRRWILVEVPGPWGRDALAESRLPAGTGRRLLALGRALRARVLAIRRHGTRGAEGCTAYVGSTAGPRRWVEELPLDRAEELLNVDLAPLARDASVGGRPVGHLLHLVCTNGRHDLCCAVRGRPLAQAFARVRPHETWECSHVGGDRFAGNVVVLPHGLYLGRVPPGAAGAVVSALEAGEVPLDFYRGRAGLPFAAQAAEHLVRERERLLGIDDVEALGWEQHTADAVAVTLRVAGGARREVVVACSQDPPELLTCSAAARSPRPRYRVLAYGPGS